MKKNTLFICILFLAIITSCNNRRENQDKEKSGDANLKEEDISGLDLQHLRILRNEIFARHGYIFKSEDLNDYFSKQKWYKPQFKDVSSLLTKNDKKNIAIILKREEALKSGLAGKTDKNKLAISDKYTLDGTFILEGNRIKLPKFEIEVSLTKSAEKRLKDSHESVIVQAYFSGVPKDTTNQQYEDYGEFNIGEYAIELTDKRVAVFGNVYIPKNIFDQLSDKNFEILINIFSGRKSSQYNILDCDILQGSVLDIKGKHYILKGKINGE